ncbi:MAG: hypothetical protein IT280_09485 [Ignavibacteria bacterium]|nr:hypothetical protein [Ignavibacteria bacterium]
MFLCQWSLDIKFGKLSEALQIINNWGAEKMNSSNFKKATGCRVYTGYIGETAAHIVDEYVFEHLEDFEIALNDMSQQQFKTFAQQMAEVIIPGTQKWHIFKIIK